MDLDGSWPAAARYTWGMNKAFCREPDADVVPVCPGCGHAGASVGPETLAAHVRPGCADTLGEPVFFCGTPACTVAYFDPLDRTLPVADAHGLFWPKDPAAPLCGCHGLTVDDVDRDIADGVPTRVRAFVARASAPGAACATVSADGRSCVARVQACYMRRRAAAGG